jgi:hypothetical protein
MVRQLARVGALLALVSGLAGCERNLPVGAAEREVVLRAADLIPFGYGLEQTEQYETFNRTRYFDGSYELTYEYHTPDSEQQNALYISVTVTVERTLSDALTSHGAEEVGLTIGLKANGVKEREIEDFYKYGDKSRFAVLEKDGKPIGNIFSVREGKRVFLLIMSGMYFEDAAAFKELIEGRLKKFSAYVPT